MALIALRGGFRLRGLRRLAEGRRQSPALKKAALDISADSAAYILKRFDRFSGGGGSWPPLRDATILRKGSTKILVDRGELRRALSVGLRPSVRWNGSWLVITTSMRSSARHKRAKMPVQRLIDIHNRGLGRVPRRRIFVSLDSVRRERAVKRLYRAMREAARGTT